jgi:hypothetical protein
VGFLIFLTLMLFAAQVLVRLFAMSAMTSAATKAAETVASAADPQASVPGAQQAAQSQLGSYRVSFDWESIGPDDVVLQVAGRSPGFLPLPSSWTTIRRTVTVHLERFQ